MDLAGRSRGMGRGFTLIELMIVVSIVMVLTILTIPSLGPAREARRLREAARSIHAYFGSARAAAMESGHNVGVMLERQQAFDIGTATSVSKRNTATVSRACLTLYQVEQPPVYAGEVDGATVVVQMRPARSSKTDPTSMILRDSNGNPQYFEVAFKATEFTMLNYDLLRIGDYVQFNNQGPRFRITGSGSTTQEITGRSLTVDSGNPWITATTEGTQQPVSSLPWPEVGGWNEETWSQPVSYRIYRQPTRTSASPLELPVPAAIDLQFSGNDSHYLNPSDPGAGEPITFAPGWVAANTYDSRPGDPMPVYIMFSPSGSVQEVYATKTNIGENASDPFPFALYHPVEPLYLLVGDRGRIKSNADTSAYSDQPTKDEYPNWYPLESLWLVLSPQNGLMRVVENYPVSADNPVVVGSGFQWNVNTVPYGAGSAAWNSVSVSKSTLNVSMSVWRRAIWQSRSMARGICYAEDTGQFMPLGQGVDDMGGR